MFPLVKDQFVNRNTYNEFVAHPLGIFQKIEMADVKKIINPCGIANHHCFRFDIWARKVNSIIHYTFFYVSPRNPSDFSSCKILVRIRYLNLPLLLPTKGISTAAKIQLFSFHRTTVTLVCIPCFFLPLTTQRYSMAQ